MSGRALDESEAAMAAKTCSRCGAVFACGAESGEGCWCEAVVLAEDAAERLASDYGDCLCQACLEAMAAPPSVASSDSSPVSAGEESPSDA